MNCKELERLYLEKDYNCAESVLRGADQAFGLKLPEAGLKLAGGFGGGFGCGHTCGALCGAIAAISACKIKSRAHEDPAFKDVCAGFTARFQAELGGLLCSELKPRYQQEGKRCLAVVEKTMALLEQYRTEMEETK